MNAFIPTLSLIVFYAIALFIISNIVERHVEKNGKSLVNNATIYTLSLAVYCTSWTFYGSVGSASKSGMLFLTIYLGPTLSIILWWKILRKLVRIKENYRITSIVDFISARYDKSISLGIIAGFLVMLGSIPYIALQLKSIISTIHIMSDVPNTQTTSSSIIGWFVVAMMSGCSIIFGIRKLNSSERHPGMIFVLAVECLVKLVAFLAVGIFVTYGLNNGLDDILGKINQVVNDKYNYMGTSSLNDFLVFATYTLMAFSAILFLPRQFHVAVVENSNENHIKKARWLFPLYLFLINIFVLPIAIGGELAGLPLTSADSFVLKLSMMSKSTLMLYLTFIGGFSAAAGMIMITTVTVSTIMTNNLLLPFIQSFSFLSFLNRYLLQVRWFCAAVFISTSYLYVQVVGSKYALVAMGMVSFAAALQFMPVILGALFWKRGSKTGATLGLSGGFTLWFVTLIIPAFVKSNWLPQELLTEGIFGLSFLRPEALFGLDQFHYLTHACFWTMLFNIGGYIIGSIYFPGSKNEQKLAQDFYEALPSENYEHLDFDDIDLSIPMKDKVIKTQNVLKKFLENEKVENMIQSTLNKFFISEDSIVSIVQFNEFYNEIEKQLSGSLGSAGAHNALKDGQIFSEDEENRLTEFYSSFFSSMKINPKELNKKISLYKEKEKLMQQETLLLEEMIKKKSEELEVQKNLTFHASKMSALGEMAGGIAHEINNPLTIIGSTTRIIKKLVERENIEADMISKKCDDIDRTIIRISKIISGLRTISRDASEEKFEKASLHTIFEDVLALCAEKFKHNNVALEVDLKESAFHETIDCRQVQLSQVFLNLIGNAYDAIEELQGDKWIKVSTKNLDDKIEIRFRDAGPGIPQEVQDKIFQPFFTTKEIGKGTGLGLSLSNSIIKSHNGDFYIDNKESTTCFVVIIPKNQINNNTNEKNYEQAQ